MINPKITFGIIVLNGEPFILYNLRALYPFAHQIIVIEGAAPSAKAISSSDGHSLDSTLKILRNFQINEDPKSKLIIVTAEDEGYPNGFWRGEKDEMSRAYAKRATGNYLWQIDSDEFYMPADMHRIIGILRNNRSISTISFRVLTFWGGLKYRTDSFYLQGGAHDFHRLFAWGPDYRYSTHRPPTVHDENGMDLRKKKSISASEMAKSGIYMYHYELLFPKQVREKCAYYRNASWTDELRYLDAWINNSYFSLANPYRVHMVYKSLSWLERFECIHPPQVVEMVNAVSQGKFPGIELRPIEDVEILMESMPYKIGRCFLKLFVPINNIRLIFFNFVKRFIKRTAIWPYLRNIKTRIKGGLTPVCIDKVSPKLLNGWKADSIPSAQNIVVSQELQEMYAGRQIKPYSVLAEAVRITGQENGELIEVGCATGYYYEVLQHLLGHNIKYHGIDYSEAMISEAKRKYPGIPFEVGNAVKLSIADGCCDILISGCVLLHVPDFRSAIAESARVSRKWVIFHRTPVTNGETCYYKKKAYGVPCIEVHFGYDEFISVCESHGLHLKKEFIISSGDSDHMVTYLFEKIKSNGNKLSDGK